MASAQGFVWYNYTPSMAAAVIMCGIFSLAAIYHVWIMIRQKTWYFIPFIIGCLFESVGYVGRILSSAEAPIFTENPYVLQSTLLLLGPTLLTASIYMVLGRLIITLQANHHAVIRPRWLTKVFVVGDVLSFFIQVTGDGMLMMAKTEDALSLANSIVVAGLVVQIAFFGFFVLVALMFHKRIQNQPTSISRTMAEPWVGLLYVLYISSVLVLIRYIYRVAEYVEGSTGTLQQNETWLYLFDALPMAVVSLLFCAYHPSRVVNPESLERAKLYSEIGIEELGNESRARINRY